VVSCPGKGGRIKEQSKKGRRQHQKKSAYPEEEFSEDWGKKEGREKNRTANREERITKFRKGETRARKLLLITLRTTLKRRNDRKKKDATTGRERREKTSGRKDSRSILEDPKGSSPVRGRILNRSGQALPSGGLSAIERGP